MRDWSRGRGEPTLSLGRSDTLRRSSHRRRHRMQGSHRARADAFSPVPGDEDTRRSTQMEWSYSGLVNRFRHFANRRLEPRRSLQLGQNQQIEFRECPSPSIIVRRYPFPSSIQSVVVYPDFHRTPASSGYLHYRPFHVTPSVSGRVYAVTWLPGAQSSESGHALHSEYDHRLHSQ